VEGEAAASAHRRASAPVGVRAQAEPGTPRARGGVPQLAEEGRLEAMAHLSPDGRPPHAPYRRRSAAVFMIVSAALALGLAALLLIGGAAAIGMALVYLPIMLVAAFPVWLSVMFRLREEK